VSNLHHPFSVKSQWRNAGHRHVRSALNIRPSPQNFEGPFCATPGLLHRNKIRTQPITLSVRASTIGSVESGYSLRVARLFISAKFVNDITYPPGDRM
jgi:hypothetical protein